MAHRVGLSGRTAASDVLLAPAIDLDALGVFRRGVEARTCRDRQTARPQQPGGGKESLVLLPVCLLENTPLAAHRPPVCRAGNVLSCAAEHRASIRARPRELIVTFIDIEPIGKQKTREDVG